MNLSEQVTLAIITGISSVILNVILLARVLATQRAESSRRHDELRRFKSEDEAARERREDERWQQQIGMLGGMLKTFEKSVTQNSQLIETINHMQSTADERNRVQKQQAAVQVEQSNALDTMQAQLIAQTQSINEAQPALEAIKTVPASLEVVKGEIAQVRTDLNGLPAHLKDELLPITNKLDDLDRHVEKLTNELKGEVAAMRSEVMAAIRAALTPPAPPTALTSDKPVEVQ